MVKKRCFVEHSDRCQPLVQIDHYGERLTGCPTCNRWQASTGEWCRLAPDDIIALTRTQSAKIALGEEDVKPAVVVVALVAWLAMISLTPALAALRQIEDFGSKQALHVTFWHQGDYEAFMANCIANLTPTPTGKRKYRKY